MSDTSLSQVLIETDRALSEHGRVALCHVVRTEGSTPGKVGWKLLVKPDGGCCGNLGGGAFEAMVKADAAEKLKQPEAQGEVKRYYLTEEAVQGEPTGMVCGGLVEVFLEVLGARPLFAICGGGPVGQALARNGQLCGLDVLVVEDREEFLRPELFPEGTQLAEVDRDFGAAFLAPFAARELVVAIVTRCWETDLAALKSVLRQAPPRMSYLGLMGSRRKVDHIRERAEEEGASLAGVELHAPIGLPIGGDTPGEIAVSVLAQIIQVRSAKAGSQEVRRAGHG